MGAHGGPNMTEDGVVFYYDTGNSKSYAGEPATNSQDPDYAAFTQAGFDAWGCYDGGSPAHTWDVNQSKTYVSIPGPDSYPVDAMLYHNFTGGFHGPTHWSGVAASLLTNGSKITVQGWVKAADAASVGKTVTPYLYYNKIGGGSYSSGTSYALTSEWQLVSHSYTVPEGSTGTGTMYFFTQNPTEVRMYLTKTAIVGGKLHAVQWLPGNTTRSVTEGLKDFTNNTTIDLTNVSFDSNAQMEFDGTDDTVALGNSSQFNITDEMSVSAWINLDSNSGWKGIFGGAESGFVHFQLYDGGINVYVYGPAAAYGNPDGITIGTNVWTNVGFTFGNNTLKVYLNGEQLTTTVTGNGGNISSNSDVRFGWAYATSRLFQGKINALTVHNRALTAEEVAENFNGIRSRFGI